MSWYSAPNMLPQALQADLEGLSKCGDAQINAILETIGDLEDYDSSNEAIDMIVTICDEFVIAAKALRKKAIGAKEAEPCGFPFYPLSENQKLFVADAERAGLEINYDYSGRGMEGKRCPAVRLMDDFHTDANYCTDSMGMGYVVYARS